MCSIEEAWAGQTFDKKVLSQGDFHNNYMSLPDNLLTRDNELTIKKTNEGQVKNLPRGINSKYSREPRVPKIVRNTSNADINISSEMPEMKNYGGLDPLPSYMSIYNNANSNNQTSNYSYPMPIMTGEHFTNIEDAYTVSDNLNKYMNLEPNLLDEDTDEEKNIITNKFTNMNKTNMNKSNKFKNLTKNKDYYNNNNNNNNDNNDTYNDDLEIKDLLNTIIKKINNIETQLSNYNNKNIYDLILYIIIGILLSFCIYSIFSKKTKL